MRRISTSKKLLNELLDPLSMSSALASVGRTIRSQMMERLRDHEKIKIWRLILNAETLTHTAFSTILRYTRLLVMGLVATRLDL